MRRDANDKKWQQIKRLVRERDKSCRLIKVVSVQEAFELKKKANRLLRVLDTAHIYPVSTHPRLTYVDSNLILLNRYSHSRLDSFRHPISGVSITYTEAMQWWERIAGKKQWSQLQKEVNK